MGIQINFLEKYNFIKVHLEYDVRYSGKYAYSVIKQQIDNILLNYINLDSSKTTINKTLLQIAVLQEGILGLAYFEITSLYLKVDFADDLTDKFMVNPERYHNINGILADYEFDLTYNVVEYETGVYHFHYREAQGGVNQLYDFAIYNLGKDFFTISPGTIDSEEGVIPERYNPRLDTAYIKYDILEKEYLINKTSLKTILTLNEIVDNPQMV